MCHAKKDPPDNTKAVAALSSSIEVEETVKAFFKRGQFYLEKGDLDAARNDFKRAQDLDADKTSSKAIQAELAKLERLEVQQKKQEKKRYAGFFTKLAEADEATAPNESTAQEAPTEEGGER